MEQFTGEHQATHGSDGQGGPPSLQELQAAEQEAAQALEVSREDPCYPVYFEKALIKRIEGFDMPWVKCLPLEISVVWDITESGGRENEHRVSLSLEESYPGYMKIEYDRKKMDRINGFYIGGPSPQRLDRINASLREVSATFFGITYDPSDLLIQPEPDCQHVHIGIANNVPWGNRSTHINSSHIAPSAKLVKALRSRVYNMIIDTGVLSVSAGDLSIEEIERGVREGNLVKQFAVHEFQAIPLLEEVFRRDGTATLRIRFAPLRERWQVIINTINVMGYGTPDRNFGVQVHTERTVELVIENGAFKNGEGKTSFVSIKPYSFPAGLYRCREENIEIAGSGTDVEAERYDQVRHAKRFNPPTTPQEEALKQEWLRITKQKTPHAFPPTYAVTGTKSGAQMDLQFPKNSGYVVAHRCDPSDQFIAEWQQKWRKKWRTTKRWTLRDYDRFLFPETVKILLEDDWYTEYTYSTKYYGPNVGWKTCPEGTPGGQLGNTDQIRVKRID